MPSTVDNQIDGTYYLFSKFHYHTHPHPSSPRWSSVGSHDFYPATVAYKRLSDICPSFNLE